MAWLRSLGSNGGSSGGASRGSSGGSWGSSFGGHSKGSRGGSWGSSYYSGSSHGSHGSSGGTIVSSPVYSESIISESPMYSESIISEGPVVDAPVEAADGYEGSTTAEYPSEVEDVEGDVAPTVDDAIEVAPLPTDGTNNRSENGSLVISLPANAKLLVNGQPTTSTGTKRQFVSKGLKAGFKYPYEVKAILEVDGEPVVRTKTVSLRAGDSHQLAFDFDVEVQTNLTVRLPENARLELAGAKTQTTGSERTFGTKKLSAGQVWSDYRIVVSYEVAGETISQVQTINLRAGEDRTLTFDFDSERLAAR